MNWNRIEGNWKQLSGTARQHWGRLTHDGLHVLAGQRDSLRGRIQERLGLSQDAGKQQQAELKRRIRAFNRVS
jgi:uncharacterized protein YjbJ (UPF0337 family)